MHVKYICQDFSAYVMVQCSWFWSVHHLTHRTYQRLMARKVYKQICEHCHAKLLGLHTTEKNAVSSQSHKNIYGCLYISILVPSSSAVLKQIPSSFTAHWLGSQSRFGAEKRWVPLAGRWPRSSAQRTGDVLQPPEGTPEAKPTSGPLGSSKPLAWWEEPIQAIKLKVAWSSNPWNAYKEHADSQH